MNEPISEPSAPVAVLYLPESRARVAMVYGHSGKRYTFQAGAAAKGRPARVYFDAASFVREEGDLRRNLRGSMAVCTLLGEADHAARARSAIAALAASTGSLGHTQVAARLQSLRSAIDSRLSALAKPAKSR